MEHQKNRLVLNVACACAVLFSSLVVTNANAGGEDSALGLAIYVGGPIAILDLTILSVDLYLTIHDRPTSMLHAVVEGIVGAGSITFGAYLLSRPDGGPATTFGLVPLAMGLGLGAHALFAKKSSALHNDAAKHTGMWTPICFGDRFLGLGYAGRW